MEESAAYPAGFGDQDILFDCPNCGKNLGIDARGAGLVVTCPDCGTKMQVPMSTPDARALAGSDKTQAGGGVEPGNMSAADYTEVAKPVSREEILQEKVHRLQLTMEEVLDRKRELEKFRIDYALRFERIREEMATIQAALDRMVDILQDVRIEKSPGA